MPTLPARPSLEHLKKQAKRLHKAAGAGKADALLAVGPYFGDPAKITLQQAQLVIARDYGFSSWAKLKRYVSSETTDDPEIEQRTNRFLDLVCLHYGPDVDRSARHFQEAADLLSRHPEIVRHSIHAASAAGDLEVVREMLDNDLGVVEQRGGPFQWTPLMYAAYARLPGASTFLAGQALLAAGADPNAHYMWGGTYRFSVLTGIFGDGERGKARLPEHPDMVPFARAVLEKGANPNDSQGAYNRCFSADDTHLELMLEYGLADSDPTDWWLTEADQDANAHRTMHFQLIIALRKGFAKRARLLIAHGVDLNKSDANYYQTPPVSFTPYQVALLYGLPDIADLIQQRGGDSTPLDPKDEFKAACMAGDRERASKLAPSILEKSPETAAEMLNEAAANGNVKAIDAMIGLGFDLNPTGARTALHAAAWSDQGEVIKRLLAAGADPKLRDPQHLTPPLVHAMYAQSQAAIDLLMAADMDIFCASALGQLSQIDARLSEDVAWLEASISRVSPGADQNQPKHWATPLWFAALNGQAEAVRHLLSKGANPALFDSAGDSIVMHLKRDGRHEIVQILEMHSH